MLSGEHKLLCAILVSLLLAGACLAQETTGVVRGSVSDASGASVPGVRVELSGGLLARAFVTSTSDAGLYSFSEVPPGTGYTVSATAPGFRGATLGGVNVQLGRAAAVDFKLEVGQISESVSVSTWAAPADMQTSTSAVIVDRSFFDLIPKTRSSYDLIALAPGARSEGKAGGFQVDGASGSENTFYLNGMEVTGIMNGTLSSQASIPVEVLQQLEIKSGVVDAQYGGALGGVANAVIRSGSNTFHGQAGFYFNNDAMQARPRPQLRLDPNNPDDNVAQYFQPSADAFRTWSPVFDIGGPLIRNKLFFFSAYTPIRTTTDRTVHFNTGQTGSYSNVHMQHYLTNRLDYTPLDKLRFSASWIWNPDMSTGVLPSPGGTDAYDSPWSARRSRSAGNILSGNVTYLPNSRLILSFRGGYHYTNYNNSYGIPQDTAIYYTNSTVGLANIPANLQYPAGWVAEAVPFTHHDTFTRQNYDADVAYIFKWHGQHNLKSGWQINKLGDDIVSSSYPNGYYRYYWDLTYKCVTDQCTEGAGAYGYYRYRVLGTFGDVSSNNQGLFFQDNWGVTRRLTLNLGLRTEREFVPSFSSDRSLPSKAITFSWPQKMSPRIGGAFDVRGDGRQKLYASFGVFYDVMKYELPRNSFGGDRWKEYFYTLDDPNLVAKNRGIPADPTSLPGKLLEVIDWRIPSNDPSQHLIDPKLKPVSQRVVDVGYDYSFSANLLA
jgi:hypothetical protein